jgi:hypothetical protein
MGSILGPPHFITHINHHPSTMKTLTEPIIFADDTTVINSNKDFDFCTLANSVLCHMSKWFTAKKLALTLGETKLIKSVINNSPQRALSIK